MLKLLSLYILGKMGTRVVEVMSKDVKQRLANDDIAGSCDGQGRGGSVLSFGS